MRVTQERERMVGQKCNIRLVSEGKHRPVFLNSVLDKLLEIILKKTYSSIKKYWNRVNITFAKGSHALQTAFRFVKGVIKHEDMGYLLIHLIDISPKLVV